MSRSPCAAPGSVAPVTSALQPGLMEASVRASSRVRRASALALALGGLVVAAGIAVMLIALSVHLVAGNSDGATVVLEGRSMGTGNFALAGWALSLDSFWLVDAVLYAIPGAFAGVHAAVLNVLPALIALAVIVVAARLALEGLVLRAGLVALATVVVVLGFPSPVFVLFFLQGPLHVATVLWCLLAFYGLRHGRFDLGWALAVVLFAAGMLGDLQMLLLGVLPAVGAGLLATVRRNDWRAGAPSVAAGIGAIVLARLGRLIASSFGTYVIGRTNPLAPLAQVGRNIGQVFTEGTAVLGVWNGPYGPSGVPGLLQALHVVVVIVIVAGVLLATARLIAALRHGLRAAPSEIAPLDPATRLEDLLVVGFFADLATFVCLAATGSDAYARYLTAGIVFGAILGGRALGNYLVAHPRRLGRGVAGLCLVAALGVVATSGYALASPAVPQPAKELGALLAAHGLRTGVGDYWSASITTVETNGAVSVRPIVEGPSGRIVRYDKQSEAGWYAGVPFQFLVYNSGQIWNGVDAASIRRTFGRPARIYVMGSYRVWVWSHPLSISTLGATQP